MSAVTEKITSSRMEETYYRVKHSSGLTMLLAPMKNFKTTYAMFGTKYGSIDTLIKKCGCSDNEKLPEGIAHYLEHKLFESEECSAFDRYAKTGANANAYTGFDRTCYLFSCSENFNESLEILLDFVTHPYFTAETVEKEQGIIGQEIKMYDDSADWKGFFNLLGAMYHNNPVKIDIAGTVESISHITADILYRCYNTFYNLHNMVLVIAGNFNIEDVMEKADRILVTAGPLEFERGDCGEPDGIVSEKVEQKFEVASPIFNMGFKGKSGTEKENSFGSILDEIFLGALCDDYTPLYRKLYDEGLINVTFSSEVFSGRDYVSMLVSGESKDPEKACDAIRKEFARVLEEGIDDSLFESSRKSIYGRYLRSTERVDGYASSLFSAYISDIDLFDIVDFIASATKNDVMNRVRKTYSTDNCSISLILPKEDNK